MFVTVAICTWNRAQSLARTLGALCGVMVPEECDLEILVVNNNCSDTTSEVVKSFAPRLPLRWQFEPRQGIAHARNCAVGNARGGLLLFLDDDCVPGPQWLSAYVSAASAWPQATLFGGAIQPVFEAAPPSWVRESADVLREVYGALDRGDVSRALSQTESVFSGNMGIRTAGLPKDPFDVRLGRVGRERIGGEEIDLFTKLTRAGAVAVWVAEARVDHCVPQENTTRHYVWRSFIGIGRTNVLSGALAESPSVLGVPRWILRQYVQAQIQTLLLESVGGASWVRAFRQAAICQGTIEQIRSERSRRTSPRSPHTSSPPVTD